ncbi:MAG TPA: methyl-accepting chemotaxis protein, partial [Clostridia bacterium]|nr:methyl-accepting chemotaxis protein [Clostridia bacterium]
EKVNNFFAERQGTLSRTTGNVTSIINGKQDDKATRTEIATFLASEWKAMKQKYGIVDMYIGYPDGNVSCGSGWAPDDPAWKANERDWYKAAKNTDGKEVYTSFYIDSDTKKPVVTIAQMIKGFNGNEFGVVGIDISLAQLMDLLNKTKIGQSGYPFLITGDGSFLIHPTYKFNDDAKKADTMFNVSNGSLKDVAKKIINKGDSQSSSKFNGISKMYYSKYINYLDAYLVSSITEKEFTKPLDDYTVTLIIIFAISIVIISLFVFLFLTRITNIIKNTQEAMKEISAGNLSVSIKKVKRNDELGVLSQSVENMQSSMKQIIGAIKDEMTNVSRAFEVNEQSIVKLVANIEDSSSTVEQLSAGMQETAASTEEINATTAEIENAVENVASKAQDGAISAGRISQKALSLKQNSVNREQEANQTIESVKVSMSAALENIKEVDKISELTNAIMQISTQTNLLALNAAIESARAGEAGKGFAVVSDEIRGLAEESKKTVAEIQKTVKTVYTAVNNLADTSRKTLDYIETNVVNSYKESVDVGINYEKDAQYVSGFVVDLSTTSEQLLASVKNVAHIMEQISTASNEGAEGTGHIAESMVGIKDMAIEVKSQMTKVMSSVNSLNALVSKFTV